MISIELIIALALTVMTSAIPFWNLALGFDSIKYITLSFLVLIPMITYLVSLLRTKKYRVRAIYSYTLPTIISLIVFYIWGKYSPFLGCSYWYISGVYLALWPILILSMFITYEGFEQHTEGKLLLSFSIKVIMLIPIAFSFAIPFIAKLSLGYALAIFIPLLILELALRLVSTNETDFWLHIIGGVLFFTISQNYTVSNNTYMFFAGLYGMQALSRYLLEISIELHDTIKYARKYVVNSKEEFDEIVKKIKKG